MIFKGDKKILEIYQGSKRITCVSMGKNLIFPKARRVKAFEKVPVDISELLPLKESNTIYWSFRCMSDKLSTDELQSNIGNVVRGDSGKAYSTYMSFLDKDLVGMTISGKEILGDPFFKNTLYATIWKGESDLLIFYEVIFKI